LALPTQAQEPATGTASFSLQAFPVLDQNSTIYQALQTVDRGFKSTRSTEAGGGELPATLTREQAASRMVYYMHRLYVEMPTATFTEMWRTQPETFKALQTLAHELGGEAAPRAGVTAPMIAAIARPPFPDVPRTHWAAGGVERLRVHGVIVGYPDRTYNGGNPLR
jgi:hypothetical protein